MGERHVHHWEGTLVSCNVHGAEAAESGPDGRKQRKPLGGVGKRLDHGAEAANSEGDNGDVDRDSAGAASDDDGDEEEVNGDDERGDGFHSLAHLRPFAREAARALDHVQADAEAARKGMRRQPRAAAAAAALLHRCAY